eukprot:gene5613-4099_t
MKKISGSQGREMFSEGKSLNLFQQKTLRVRRIYDEKQKSLIYVAYSTRLSSASDDGAVTAGRYRTSLCAIPLVVQPAPAPPLLAAEPAATPAAAPPAAVAPAAATQPAVTPAAVTPAEASLN